MIIDASPLSWDYHAVYMINDKHDVMVRLVHTYMLLADLVCRVSHCSGIWGVAWILIPIFGTWIFNLAVSFALGNSILWTCLCPDYWHNETLWPTKGMCRYLAYVNCACQMGGCWGYESKNADICTSIS